MVGHTHRPILQRAAVEHVLNALRSGHDLGNHALKHFLIIRERLAEPHTLTGEQAAEVSIMDYVVELILERLTCVRALYDLPAPDRACSDVLLMQDFHPGNEELQAWSVLYHRYVCVDHDFSMQALGDLVKFDVRTISRRHKLGLTRLTRKLLRLEQAARWHDAQRRMQIALPSVRPPLLINGDNLLPPLCHFLLEAEPPRHVVLHGPAGIGKTALAVEAAHELIQRSQLDDLVWLDGKSLNVQVPVVHSTLAAQLGLTVTDVTHSLNALRAYLFTHTVLIVLDDVGPLVHDSARLHAILDMLGSARVMLTSRVHEPEHVWCYHMTVPPFTRAQAFEFLDHVAHRSSPHQNWESHFSAIWDAAGGNPLALKTILKLAHRLSVGHPLTNTELERLYQEVWDQLSENAQRVWLLALLFPQAVVEYDAIRDLAALDSTALEQALHALTSAGLFEIQPEHSTVAYSMPPVFVTFLLSRLAQGLCLASGASAKDYLCAAAHLQFELLMAAPTPITALHLLTRAATLDIDPVVQWHWAAQLSTQIMDGGFWSLWSQVLQQLADAPLSDPQQIAWIAWMQGIALRWLGQFPQARMHLERAASAYPADVQIELGVISRYRSHWDEAHRHLHAALVAYQAEAHQAGIERCVHELAQLALDATQTEQALAWLSRLDEWSPRTWGIASQAYLQLGDHAQAAEAAAAALAGLPAQHPNYARTLVILGQIADARGDFDAAVRMLHHALDLLNQCKDILAYARTCNNLAVAYLHQDADERDATLDEIRARLHEARDIQQSIGDEIGLAVTQQNLAWLAAAQDAATED